jgi:hypothetical protein
MIKDLGPLHHFIGITIKHRPDGMFLNQRTYTLDIIKRVAMADCEPVHDSGRPLGEARYKLWASCSRRYTVLEHCRGSLVPDLNTAQHRLCPTADLSTYA